MSETPPTEPSTRLTDRQKSVRVSLAKLMDQNRLVRLVVDATQLGVAVPQHVKAQFGEELVIDLDPAYPLHTEFTDSAVLVDLAFSGVVMRCEFPYLHIRLVIDVATQQGFVFEPLALSADGKTKGSTEPEKPKKSFLRVIKGGRG